MIQTIIHNNTDYPKFQSEGFAAQFAFPFARKVCSGSGLDVGCNRKEWGYVDAEGVSAMLIDPAIEGCEYTAENLPPGKFDYIFSSHCVEHVGDWVGVLDYWETKIKIGGVLFLYLPAYQQSYWRPWNNRKHIHSLHPEVIKDYLTDRGWGKIFVSGVDLNSSFMVMAGKI